MLFDIQQQINFFKRKENFNNDDKIELIEFAEALFHRLIQAENVFSDLSDSSSLFEKRYKYNTLYRWD